MNQLEKFVDDTVIRGRNHTYHFDTPKPPLSIKTMRNGTALYEIDGGRFAVNDDSYLVLNEGQDYTITIESHTVVQSFCIFFPHGWAVDVARGLTAPDAQLIDNVAVPRSVLFFERLTPHNPSITPLLREIEQVILGGTATVGQLEESYRLLLARLLHLQFGLYREAEKLPAARAVTRIELYRRLHRARDYMHASLSRAVTLEEIAAVAYLSPFHFLRTFKRVFGVTPHAYMTEKRLERAMFLLRHTDLSVTDICLEVGFESLSSFSTLFRRYTGLSPRAYRQEISA